MVLTNDPGECEESENRYRGWAFEPRVSGTAAGAENAPVSKTFGIIEVTSQKLLFSGDSLSLELPLDGLRIARGGAGKRLIFFTHPQYPERTIFTADRSILRSYELLSLPDLSDHVKRIGRQTRLGRIIVSSVLLALCAGIVGVLFFREVFISLAVQRVPVTWEQELSDHAFAEIRKTTRLVSDDQVLEGLRTLVQPLLDAISSGTEPRSYNFTFHVIAEPTMNAFALPGGRVTIHSGLLLAAERPEEILGVFAHELAHVMHQHSLRQMVRSASVFVLASALVGDVSSIVDLAFASTFVLGRKFSRDDERDADVTGWEYLTRAGVDPRGMIEVFRRIDAARLERHDRAAGPGVPGILSTHPATDERIEALEERGRLLDGRAGFRRPGIDYDAFKERLRAAIDR